MNLTAISLVTGCLVASFAAGACGGGSSSSGKAPDSSKIATATLPATLPAVKILSNSGVLSSGAASYTVKEGDTLAGIASRFGVSLEDLKAANPNLDASKLSIGQTIRLPADVDARTPAPATATPPPAVVESPTVKPAATEVPPTDIPPPTLPPPADTPVPAAPTPTAAPASVGQTYVVEDGDFPAKIAEKFGIAVDDLLAANPGINSTDLHVGQIIVIPPKPQP